MKKVLLVVILLALTPFVFLPPPAHAVNQPIGYGPVPLYGNNQPRVQHLIALRAQYPSVPMVVIVNNGNGAGGSQSASYVTWITNMRAAGITVIGYSFDCNPSGAITCSGASVATRNLIGSDSSSQGTPDHNRGVEQSIDAWASFYTVDGIFFDNAEPGSNINNPAPGWAGHTVLQYYTQAASYAASTYSYTFVMHNVAVVADSMVGVGDVLNIEDETGMEPTPATLNSWTISHGGTSEDFSLILNPQTSAPTVAYLQSIQTYISWIYPTDVAYTMEPSYQNTTLANLANVQAPSGGVTVIVSCTFTSLQCWLYPLFFMMVFTIMFLLIVRIEKAENKQAIHLLFTALTYGSMIAVVLGLMTIVVPLILLVMNTLYVLRMRNR